MTTIIIKFRDFFFLKLKNRYPAFTEHVLNKESVNCLLILFSGYYVALITILLIILHKFQIIKPVSAGNEFITRIIVGVLFIGPIFLIRRYMILKSGLISVDNDPRNQKKILKQMIVVCFSGYTIIFIVAPLLNYLLTFL